MTDAERVEFWKGRASDNLKVALSLQARIDGWSAEQLEAITALVESHDLFDPWHDLDRDEFELMLNMNDTFYWGTADGEPIRPEDAIEVHAVSKEFGADGVTAWVALRRGYGPMETIAQRKDYQKAHAALFSRQE